MRQEPPLLERAARDAALLAGMQNADASVSDGSSEVVVVGIGASERGRLHSNWFRALIANPAIADV